VIESNGKPGAKLDTLQRVELTEGVAIRLRTAGPMVRMLAIGIDILIQFGCIIGLFILFGIFVEVFGEDGLNVGFGLLLIALFLVFWFYFVFFEAGKRNATPGKRCLGLRVARTSGAPPGIGQVVIRNFLRLVDFLPMIPIFPLVPLPTYAFGLVACAFTRNFQRLGDLAADTVVVYNEREPKHNPVHLDIQAIAPDVPLTREEQLSVVSFVERIGEWSDDRRSEMADVLEPLTGATGEEGVRRVLGIGLWIRSENEGRAQTF
jgi:uncharacterized RDD family membrane protein YckC